MAKVDAEQTIPGEPALTFQFPTLSNVWMKLAFSRVYTTSLKWGAAVRS